MLPLILAVFVASLLGSMHCVGMCGPLAMLASGVGNASGKSRPWSTWIAYHGGRFVAYALLGFIAGWIGSSIQSTGSWLGMQRLAAKLAGGSMLVIGLLTIVHLIQGAGHRLWIPKRVQTWLAAGHAWARKQPPLRRAGTIGMLTAVLPCGWLYSFLLVAAGTASAVSGALVMATFSLGSVPALVGVVATTGLLVGRLGKAIPWCSAILVTLVGGYTLVQRSAVDLSVLHGSIAQQPELELTTDANGSMASIDSANKSEAKTLIQQVESLEHRRMPCCEAKEAESAKEVLAEQGLNENGLDENRLDENRLDEQHDQLDRVEPIEIAEKGSDGSK